MLAIGINLELDNWLIVLFHKVRNRRPYLETRVLIEIVFHLFDRFGNIGYLQAIGLWGHIYRIISRIS